MQQPEQQEQHLLPQLLLQVLLLPLLLSLLLLLLLLLFRLLLLAAAAAASAVAAAAAATDYCCCSCYCCCYCSPARHISAPKATPPHQTTPRDTTPHTAPQCWSPLFAISSSCHRHPVVMAIDMSLPCYRHALLAVGRLSRSDWPCLIGLDMPLHCVALDSAAARGKTHAATRPCVSKLPRVVSQAHLVEWKCCHGHRVVVPRHSR